MAKIAGKVQKLSWKCSIFRISVKNFTDFYHFFKVHIDLEKNF